MSNHADQFNVVTTPSGKKAYEAHCAIWRSREREVMIAAPTLEELELAWMHITGISFNPAEAQHVYVVKAEK